MKITMDDLVIQLGNPGRFQIFIYILLGLNYFPVVTNHLLMAVFGSKVPFHCDVGGSEDSVENGYKYLTTNMTDVIVTTQRVQSQDACEMPVRDSLNRTTNQTVLCTKGWVFDTTEVTIKSEWNLVCDKKHLVPLATTIYFCGVMMGGLIFGFLSDHFGRKPFILVTLYCQIAVGIAIFFIPNYIGFVMLRFVQGALMQGLQTTSYAMVMELFRPAHRSIVGAALELFWGCSYIILAGIWYLIQDWRYIQLAITLPTLLTIAYIWIMPESLRWLLLKNKFDEADKVVQRMVSMNKIPYPQETFTMLKSQIKSLDNDAMVRYTVLDLMKTPVIRRRSFILFYVWFATALGYYGLSLSTTKLAGNKFLNFFISGVVELPAYLASVYILNRFGRRRPMAGFFILCGVMCLAAGILNSDDPVREKLSVVFALIGKFSTAGLFSVIFLYSAELYPTVIRNVGCGACAFWLRLSGVAAPQILRLGLVSFEQLPIIIFGTMALIGGGLTLLLPETLNTKLPDKIEDVEGVQSLQMEDFPNEAMTVDVNMPLKPSGDSELVNDTI